MVKKITAKKKNMGISKSELEKIKKSIPSVKPDKLDIYLIEEAKKYDDGTFVKYYPGMFSGNKKNR